jgi:predicted nucleic acid-binding protein
MILVDTSALYAMLDRDDENHPAANEAWGRLLQDDEPLLVTNYVVVETTALVQHRLGMGAVRVLCGDVLPALDLHVITEDEHRHAQNAMLAADRRKLSLVDCSSFQVMRARQVRRAFVFDPHFREQGFEVLPPAAPVDGDG